MKNTGICPKCESRNIMFVPGSVKGYWEGNSIFIGMTILTAVLVDRYICCECGYSEEWVDTSDIPKLKKKFNK